MKKFYILFVFAFIMMFSIKVKAYTSSDLSNLKSAVSQNCGVTISDQYAIQILNKWEVEKNTYSTLIMNYVSQAGALNANLVSLINSEDSTTIRIRGLYASNAPGYTGTITFGGPATQTVQKTNYVNLGTWENFHTVPIEWDNPQYNPNMPIPEFTTNYGAISVNSSSPEIPFDIEFQNPSTDYFIEIYVNYWIPDNMSISINRTLLNNDGYVYKALSRDLVNDYLIEPEQMLKISGINNFKLQLQTSWENALDNVPESSIEYANPNNLPNGMFTQYKNTYENYCRRILGFYGSQFTIMMRYFAVVNETEYVIGAWRTWTSYSPNEFTERIPDYYVPYVPASGQENITNDVDPETVSVVSGSGTSTGVVADPNYYITVNQNTPNYPDYPTIASYNKDNLLLDTINQMNSLSSFFGQFGEFLTLSFSFFPAWIWAIIGVGFSISIVVMFLKIL